MAVRLIRTTEPSLAEQARIVRERCPELYSYLEERDRTLRRALGRIPSRADIELSATFDDRAHARRVIAGLAPGIAELGRD